MACQIQIEGFQAGPPYSGNSPITVTVRGRTSGDCAQVRVIVKPTPTAIWPLFTQVLNVDYSSAVPSDPFTGLFTATFPLVAANLECGDELYVTANCVDGSCSAGGMFPIECKPAPNGGNNGNGHNGNNGNGHGGNGNPWPPSRCLVSGITAAEALLGALAAFALAIAIHSPVAWAAGVVALAIFAAAWALWLFWCGPDICTRTGVICWVFKRAFIASWAAIPFSTDALTLLVIMGYGSVAGLLVARLQAIHCTVPSSRRPITSIIS
jgi:hypothetical protein